MSNAAEEGTADNAFGELATLIAPRPITPPTQKAVVAFGRVHHNLLTDALIFQYVKVHGPRWRALARSLGGRPAGYSDDAVRNRYVRICEALKIPYIPAHPRAHTPRKPAAATSRWKPEEDALIRERFATVGPHWAEVQRGLETHRTPHAIRNRAARLGLRD